MPLLTWLTREEDIEATKRVAYRLLEEVHELSTGDGNNGKRLIPLLPVRLDIDLRNATVSAGGLRKSQRSPCLIRVFQQWEGTPHHALPEPRG